MQLWGIFYLLTENSGIKRQAGTEQDLMKMQENEKIKITYVGEVPLEKPGDNDRSWIAGDIYEDEKKGRKKHRRPSPRILIPIGMMIIAVCSGAAIYHFTSQKQENSDSSVSASVNSSSYSDGGINPPEQNSAEFSSSETVSENTASSEPDEVSFPSYLLPPEGYDYASPVPESEMQNEEWFSDAVFIGNSRTQGLLLYTGLQTQVLADVGLTVETVSTAASFSDPDGGEEKITAIAALQKMDFHKVYLMFGVNELGWSNEDYFFSKYVSLIAAIREKHPEAQIYVQAILPVYESKIKDKDYLTNARIISFNSRLQSMAEEQQVYYLDTYSAVADENGALPENMSSDGIHLQRDGCKQWERYILSHCVTSEPSPTHTSDENKNEKGYASINIPNVHPVSNG